MSQESEAYDLVVIGGGPGGYTAAVRASQLGMRVALVERETLGGVCLNWGCIPTKALLKQAELWSQLSRGEEFGFALSDARFDWQKVVARSRDTADGLAQGVAYLMKKNGVEVYAGMGRVTPLRSVEVRDGEDAVVHVLEASQILIATGSTPRSLPGIEIDGERIISSRQAMVLESLPSDILIVGAGAIGVEFAYFFNAFGSRVTLLESLPQILPREDGEAAEALRASLERQGVAIETDARVQGVQVESDGVHVDFETPAGKTEATVERVLMAVGVSAQSAGLGLEALGVRMRAGAIEVDERQQTSVEGIWAIGDVAGPPQLAHVASAEGIAAVEFMAGRSRPGVDRSAVPSCIYSHPQVASVGMSEEQAREEGIEINVGRFPFAASGKARAAGETEGFVKLVFGSRYGELLGGVVVGAEATELVGELALGLRLEATYEELLHTIHAHPTMAEGIMEAAGEAFGEAINI